MKISKKVKTPSLVVIPMLLIVVVVYLIITYKAERYAEEKITRYSYTHKGNTAYEVFLVPNILYEEESLSENNTYITEFVDYITAKFSYQFTGDRDAKLDCIYDVAAVVQGYTGDNDTINKSTRKLYPYTRQQV